MQGQEGHWLETCEASWKEKRCDSRAKRAPPPLLTVGRAERVHMSGVDTFST